MKRNRSESKYFNTACLMDEALIALLAKKELEYITVKEICEKAGVHRSTFYLHYETMGDLLEESVALWRIISANIWRGRPRVSPAAYPSCRRKNSIL